MKALRIFTGILITSGLIVMSSCSDSITSSLNSASGESQNSVSGNKDGDTFSSTFLVGPGEQLFLNSGVTSLAHIFEYSVSNCDMSTKDLFISASNIDMSQSLACASSEYFLDDLLIENRSSQTKKLEIKLRGVAK